MLTTKTARSVVLLVVFSMLVLQAGCADKGTEKPVFKVRGKLLHDGKPMSGAEIAFIPADPSQRNLQSRGKADSNGEYTLNTYRQNDGAPAGEYVVTIYWPAPLGKKMAEKLEKLESSEAKDEIVAPDRLRYAYSDPQKTKLKATVGEQDNEIDFKLP